MYKVVEVVCPITHYYSLKVRLMRISINPSIISIKNTYIYKLIKI